MHVFAAHGYPRVLQELINRIVLLKRLSHPNIIPIIGVTMDPFQIVTEQMHDGNLIEYLEGHPEADRISLVSPLMFIAFDQS